MKINSGRKLFFAILGLVAGFFVWEAFDWFIALFT